MTPSNSNVSDSECLIERLVENMRVSLEIQMETCDLLGRLIRTKTGRNDSPGRNGAPDK